uniref:Uncharacterized protein n=1 Tax=Glossina pallidipes TaxID=7398 RepID=A0A1B0A1A4_GLOPL
MDYKRRKAYKESVHGSCFANYYCEALVVTKFEKTQKKKRIEQHLLRTYIEINRRQKLKLDLMGVLQKQNKKDLILKLINLCATQWSSANTIDKDKMCYGSTETRKFPEKLDT